MKLSQAREAFGSALKILFSARAKLPVKSLARKKIDSAIESMFARDWINLNRN